MALCFYAPTFLDESLTYPDKRGRQFPTGRLSGFVIGRRFRKTKGGKVRADRMLLPFSWEQDTQEAKADALVKAISGMEELPGLDENPMTDKSKEIEDLIDKASKSNMADDAMKFAQAALNAANALCSLKVATSKQ